MYFLILYIRTEFLFELKIINEYLILYIYSFVFLNSNLKHYILCLKIWDATHMEPQRLEIDLEQEFLLLLTHH
jgi:hypothetical protein